MSSGMLKGARKKIESAPRGIFIGVGILLAFLFFLLLRGQPLRTIQIEYYNEHASGCNFSDDTACFDDLVIAEVADTEESRGKGLGGRSSLAEDRGMLFVFDEPALPKFWMKDVNFPIDIVWISDSLRVVDIKEDVSPDTYPKSFGPKAPSKYVLELKAGTAKQKQFYSGMKLRFSLDK